MAKYSLDKLSFSGCNILTPFSVLSILGCKLQFLMGTVIFCILNDHTSFPKKDLSDCDKIFLTLKREVSVFSVSVIPLDKQSVTLGLYQSCKNVSVYYTSGILWFLPHCAGPSELFHS